MDKILDSNKQATNENTENLQKKDLNNKQPTAEERVEKLEDDLEQSEIEYEVLFNRMKKLRDSLTKLDNQESNDNSPTI
jgi:hypothetical protein